MCRKLIFLLIAIFYATIMFSQEEYSVTLYPDKDAMILSCYADNNYGTYSRIRSEKWTSGAWFTRRSYVEFNLDSLPDNAIIQSATFTLYGIEHSPLQRSNASYLCPVDASWSETTLTWNNQPTHSTTNAISLAGSTSATQNYTLDVKDYIQGWIDGDYDNNGFVFRLQDENTTQYTRMSFASSDYTTDTTKCPKLEITYKIADELTIKPDKDALVWTLTPTTNYGNATTLEAQFYSSKSQYTYRGYIEVDLDDLPAYVEIADAYLLLSGISHSTPNGSSIRRVTSSWTENAITWNNQPTSTIIGVVSLAQSDSATQNYKVDITQFVKDWRDGLYDNNGLSLQLQSETTIGTLQFASSDYTTDTTKRPQVVIRYYDDVCISDTLQWTELVNCEVSGDTLRKNAGGSAWNAGAGSRNILKAEEDGWVEYRFVDDFATSYKMFGLSDVNSSASYNTIDCAMYMANGALYVRHMMGSAYIGAYSLGDYFKVVRSGDSINYYQNNTLVHSAVDPSYSTYQLVVDVAFNRQGDYFKGIKTSFCNYPYLHLNTKVIDTLYTYVLNGNIIEDDTVDVGTKERWQLDRILPDSTDVFHFHIMRGDYNDSLNILFDMNSTYTISNVRAIVNGGEDTLSMDSSLYKVRYGSELVFYQGDTMAREDPMDMYLKLEHGVLLTPNDDGKYDSLVIVGVNEVDTFLLVIYDLGQDTVFTSTDPTICWDGKDKDTHDPVSEGVYHYEMDADDRRLKGQMIIEF